jgi:hypothetical protein
MVQNVIREYHSESASAQIFPGPLRHAFDILDVPGAGVLSRKPYITGERFQPSERPVA